MTTNSNMRDILIYFSLKYNGNFDSIYKALQTKEAPPTEEEFLRLKSLIPTDVQIVTILDKEYPQVLKSINFPPFVIFCKGDVALLNEPTVCAVGNFDYTEQFLLEGYLRKAEICNVYPLTKRTGKKGPICKTIGVLGVSILDMIETDADLVISEYPFAIEDKDAWKKRDRLVAGLAMSVLIGKTEKAGNPNIIAAFVADNKRPLYLIPGSKQTDRILDKVGQEIGGVLEYVATLR